MNLRNFPSGLRLQLSALAVFLLAIPWLGYHYIESFTQHLRVGQTRSLSSVARTAAVAVQGEPDIFSKVDATDGFRRDRDLYAYRLDSAPELDGRPSEWHEHIRHAIDYGEDNIIEGHQGESLAFEQITGFHGDSLYGFFRVRDDRTVYREVNSISVHRNDNLQIGLLIGDVHRRYTMAAMQPGEISAYTVAPRDRGGRALSSEPRIRGYWRATEQGYDIEIRIPLELIDGRLGFAISDVDSQASRDPVSTIGTSNIYNPEDIGTLTIPSGKLEGRLSQFGYTSSSIHVLDKYGRIIATAGDITNAHGIWEPVDEDATEEAGNRLLAPLFSRLLQPPPGYFVDRIADAANVPGAHIDVALKGSPAIATRPSSDGAASIMSAAHPIIYDSKVLGAVLAEQTTNGIIASRNKAIRDLTTTSIVSLLIGTMVLLLTGSIISWRIRRLRHQLEASIDTQGRVRRLLPASRAGDEIGDLSRSFTNMARRLQQYNTYLEDMSRRLTHELRTPITVVRSSLDNLALQDLGDEQKVYVERANEGVHRLASILTSMSEATRLEQTMDTAEQELFDLTEVVSGCVQGYQLAFPDQAFVPDVETDSINLEGVPDLVAQMLDKLVGNAVEFAREDTPVKVRLTREGDFAVIRVLNDGPELPVSMGDRLFDSMVSVRGEDAGEGSHLGLGLYIARIIAEFHGGHITAGNREDTGGVIVTVYLPVMRLTGRRL